MDSFIQGLLAEFPGGENLDKSVPTPNTYRDSLALYQRSRDLEGSALRLDANIDPAYQAATPGVKRVLFQEEMQDAQGMFGQYPTYKPVGSKSVRAGDRSYAIPMYAKPKGTGDVMTDVFLDALKTEFPLK